ncbi:MAG: helix-turn-helix transcriptional regulator [Tyzzerella sp.]|nr:helix-turn-helix transcriptional regulator [Tyzzerella sp.]
MHLFSLHEKKQHGTLEFPVAYYDIIPTHPHYTMPFHWHKEWELIRIRKGTVTLHVDDCEYTAREGDILLFRESMLHGSPPPEDVAYDCLVFDLRGLFQGNELLKKHLRPIYRMESLPDIYYPKESNTDIYPYVAELMDIHYHYQQNSSDANFLELVTVSTLSHLFLRILQNGHYSGNTEAVPSSKHRISQIKAVLEYMELHYKEEITLDDLGNIANMNPRYLCRIFKQITSLSPMDYVNYLRIEQTCTLLTTTTLPIIEIALDCGFNDCSYFTRVFKKRKGMTPREYRKLV